MEVEFQGVRFASERQNGLGELTKAGLRPDSPVILSSDGETYLEQGVELLAFLDDGGFEVWLAHPERKAMGYRVKLRDEEGFRRWLDEPKPGKIRALLRADGFELVTNLGKLLGPDANGPSLPAREGILDVGGLREGMLLLRQRFPDAPDACLVPSRAMEISRIAQSFSGFFSEDGNPIFEELCWVYPRPAQKAPLKHTVGPSSVLEGKQP
jgi:hypothetical protein